MKVLKVFKSLKVLIIVCFTLVIIAANVVVAMIAVSKSSSSMDKMINTQVDGLISAVESQIESFTYAQFETLQTIASMPTFKDPKISMFEKQDELDGIASENANLIGFNITDLQGNSRTREGGLANFSERDYFKGALKGQQVIYGPIINKVSNSLTLFFGYPLKDNNGKIINTFFLAVKGDYLSTMCGGFQIGQTGHPIIVNRNSGVIVADSDIENVKNNVNIIEYSKANPELSALLEKMTAGEALTSTYTEQKQKYLISFAPVSGTDWSILVRVPYSEFNQDITKLKKITGYLTLVIMIIGIAIAVMLGNLINPLKKVGNAINEIASGNADLTKRLEVRHATTEIAEVVDGFNKFVEKLQSIITNLKNSEHTLSDVDENLQMSTQDTSSSILEILGSIDHVNGDIVRQVSSVSGTAAAVNQISSNIESLEKMIENQSAGVTQASSAVEEMIGNINSVNNAVEKMYKSFGLLEQNANSGITNQNNANEKIKQIEEESKMLHDANTAISNIANQTNLLAMNAAIEAAHAGEAGKGFSVVADEIRKLSETSAQQSKTIGEQLNKIQDSIESVVQASGDTNTALSSVSQSITETSQIIMQIKSAMEEQQIGSKQIIEALQSMNNSTTEVKSASEEMTAGNKQILDEVQKLQEITDKIKARVVDMSNGAAKVNQNGDAMKEISGKVTGSIQQIKGEIDLFNV